MRLGGGRMGERQHRVLGACQSNDTRCVESQGIVISQVITMSYLEYLNLAILIATVHMDTYLRVR